MVGTIPRSIRICMPNLVMIGPVVWPPILDRHTHRQTEFEIVALNPPPVGWGGVVVKKTNFGSNFFLSIFSAVREISRTFVEMLTPNTPGTWVKTNIIDFLDSS